jgi:hypothetical protein
MARKSIIQREKKKQSLEQKYQNIHQLRKKKMGLPTLAAETHN